MRGNEGQRDSPSKSRAFGSYDFISAWRSALSNTYISCSYPRPMIVCTVKQKKHPDELTLSALLSSWSLLTHVHCVKMNWLLVLLLHLSVWALLYRFLYTAHILKKIYRSGGNVKKIKGFICILVLGCSLRILKQVRNDSQAKSIFRGSVQQRKPPCFSQDKFFFFFLK